MKRLENVKIGATSLGVEDHGIFSFWLHLEGKGWGIGFGGIALDGPSEDRQSRIGWDKAVPLLAKICEVAGVDTWEKVKGRLIRADVDSSCKRIGHIIDDVWLDLDEFIGKAKP